MTAVAERTPRQEARRTELVDAALRSIRRHGPEVSMEQIAAEAGVTKPILYRHFGDKSGMHHAVAERQMGEMMEGMVAALGAVEPGPALVAATIDVYFRLAEEDPEVYRFLCMRTAADASVTREEETSRKDFAQGFAEMLAAYFRGVGFDSEASAAWGVAMVGITESVGQWWLDQPRRMPRQRVIGHLADLLWHGFGTLGEGLGQRLNAQDGGRRTSKGQGR